MKTIAQKYDDAMTVQLIDRVVISERYVTYIALSSNGVDQYTVTVVAGKSTGCNCPAKVACKHMLAAEMQEGFEAAWNAPLVPATVDETAAQVDDMPAMTVAEMVLGEQFAQDIEQHIEDEFSGEALADEILESERAEEKRKRFEEVCARVREIETGLTEEQRHTLERTRYVLAQNAKQLERKAAREQASLGKQERIVEEGPCGPVLMRAG